MNQNDRRVKRTRASLKNALIHLLSSHTLNTITIEMLVTKADVHRATFYTHYQDIYDLYSSIENETIETLKQMIESSEVNQYADIYSVLIDYVYENIDRFSVLLSHQNEHAFIDSVSSIIEATYLQVWKQEGPYTFTDQGMMHLTKYHISGCIALISAWVKGAPSTEMNKEKLASLLQSINTHFETLKLD